LPLRTGVACLAALLIAGCGSGTGARPPTGASAGHATPHRGGSEFARRCDSRVEGPEGLKAGAAVAAGGVRFDALGDAAHLSASDLAPLKHRYLAYKTVTEVDAGRTVTVEIGSGSRPYARLLYDASRFREDGRYLLAEGETGVTFSACAASQPRSAGAGTVGRRTEFNGGFIVAGRRCVSLFISSRATPQQARVVVAFGVPRCS
jgi:hypothetical protein